MIQCSVSHQSDMDLPVSEEDLQRILHQIFSHNRLMGIPQPALISLVFVDDPEMRDMNREYRKIDSTTDVLSFVLQENTPEGYLMGEIAISLPRALHDANEMNMDFLDEIVRLIVHGLSHILGFDHDTDEQERAMKEAEDSFYQLYCPSEDCC
jgi:probable rRNA maturation factor